MKKLTDNTMRKGFYAIIAVVVILVLVIAGSIAYNTHLLLSIEWVGMSLFMFSAAALTIPAFIGKAYQKEVELKYRDDEKTRIN